MMTIGEKGVVVRVMNARILNTACILSFNIPIYPGLYFVVHRLYHLEGGSASARQVSQSVYHENKESTCTVYG